jgi:hypothetical protein
MPRVAPQDSLQPCRISGCLYTPYVPDQQILGIINNLFVRRTFQDLARYPRILGIDD